MPVDDNVALGVVDRPLEVAELFVAVAHRGEHRADVRVLGEGVADRAGRVAAGIDARRAGGQSGHGTRPEGHPAVGDRRAVLDHERVSPSSGGPSSSVTGESACMTDASGLAAAMSSRTRRTCSSVALSALFTITRSAMRRFASPG